MVDGCDATGAGLYFVAGAIIFFATNVTNGHEWFLLLVYSV